MYEVYENKILFMYLIFIFLFVFRINEVLNAYDISNITELFFDEDDKKENTPPIIKYEDKYNFKNIEIDDDDELTEEKLNGLQNCFILENTPNGNVLILYKHDIASFIYYSDNSIPYKYLDAVSRKYVSTFKCKKIYTNVETQYTNPNCVDTNISLPLEKKEQNPSVFAKFKNYNKDKDKKPVNITCQKNRYTHQGKIANFNFLKKVDKRLVNKKLTLTFSDYKKLNI